MTALIQNQALSLVIPYLSVSDRVSFEQVDTICRKFKLEFEEVSYDRLQKLLIEAAREGPRDIYLYDETGFHRETLLGILGKGGSKIALHLEEGRALLIPNMASYTQENVLIEWKRIVHEEVLMSRVLTKAGLLSLRSKRVAIALSEDFRHAFIPAYMSQTFEKFKETHGWHIRDLRNPESSTWKREQNYLFQSQEDRLEEKNWDLVLDPLLTDIAKICIHKLPVYGDAQNLAVVKKSSGPILLSVYEIRYFGFDFSYKDEALDPPDLEKKFSESEVLSNTKITARRERMISNFLDQIFFYEFGWGHGEYRDFRLRLEDKYNQEIIGRIKTMTAQPDSSGEGEKT